MKFQMLLEMWQPKKALQCAQPHLFHIFELHVIGYQRGHLLGIFDREAHLRHSPISHFSSDLRVSVEANAIGNTEGGRLTDIVQQHPKG